LQGCPEGGFDDGVGWDVGPRTHCNLPDQHFLQLRSCAKLGTIEYNVPPGTQVDLSGVGVDLKASNVNILSSTGPGVIQLQLADGTVVSQSFIWDNIDDALVLSNPPVVESWLNSYGSDIAYITVSIQDIDVESVEGGNTLISEIEVNDILVGADTVSWYFDPSSCGGISPDLQICF